MIPNEKFLQMYSPKGEIQLAILPFELALIDQKLATLDAKEGANLAEKVSLASQSGDTWHDGAFNETDRATRAIAKERSGLLAVQSSVVVDYPKPEEKRITIGSRVYYLDDDVERTVDVVGYSPVHDRNNLEVSPVSLTAPIARFLIGKIEGDTGTFRVSTAKTIKILGIDQEAILSGSRDESTSAKS